MPCQPNLKCLAVLVKIAGNTIGDCKSVCYLLNLMLCSASEFVCNLMCSAMSVI